MVFSHSDFPHWLLWLSNALLLSLWLYAASDKELWRRLLRGRTLYLVLVVVFLWLMRIDVYAGVSAGMNFHLLGITLAMAVLKPRAALLLVSMVWLMVFAPVYVHSGDWLAIAPNLLISVLPAWLLTLAMWRLLRRFFPSQLFVFIFGNGFITAALSMLATGAVMGLALLGSAHFEGNVILEQVLPIYVLLFWGEAFLTGLLVAVMVAFRPHWLDGYSDDDYLPPAPPPLW